MSCPQFSYANGSSSSQLLMAGQSSAPSGGSPVAGQPLHSPSGCCESGRPIITDPLTGQTVCSCQYDSASAQAQQLLNYQRLAASGLSLNMYSSPYTDQGYLPLTSEQSAFYTPTDNLATWPYPASMYYPYDPTLAGYPFANGYTDLSGARRKNATRETTSTLKAWLNEHKKNPYPTKGEKIMLAIITKMTLTQVSTWFANARRRLKKENKMTWEPRNRVDDDDNDNSTGEVVDVSDHKGSGGVGVTGGGADKTPDSKDSDVDGARRGQDMKDNVDMDDDRESISISTDPTMDVSKRDMHAFSDSMSSPSSVLSDSPSSAHSPGLSMSDNMCGPPSATAVSSPGNTDVTPSGSLKPRIWSIVDTATNNSPHAAPSNFYAVSGNFGVGSVSSSGPKAPPMQHHLARNLRLGYSAPYPNTPVWLKSAFAAAAAAAASASATAPQSHHQTTPCTSVPSSTPLQPSSSSSTYSSAPSTGIPVAAATAEGPVTMARTAVPPNSSYAISMSMNMSGTHAGLSGVNSALLGRSYAQSLSNFAHLPKGFNPLVSPQQLTGAMSATIKMEPQVPQDQRSELQGSAS